MQFDDIDPARLRRRSGKKWAAHPEDVLCAWVADMDFTPARPILDALQAMVAAGDLGYGPFPKDEPIYEVFASRCAARYGWTVDTGSVELLSDVVQGLYMALRCFTEPGQGAILSTPIYPPFLNAVRETGRRLVAQPLVRGAGGYEIDLDAFAAAIDPDTKLLMLCSPHNPSGRAWRRDELEALGELVLRHDLTVVSDEIHADLVMDDRPHIPFASLSPEIAARTMTLMSASKAYNIAGLHCAVMVTGSADLRRRLSEGQPKGLRGGVSTAGVLAARVAWQSCDEWLAAARTYLRDNRDFVASFVAERLPGVAHAAPEATYLAWLDCRELDLPQPPGRYLMDHARVALSEGTDFGPPGAGHVRLNFATSRAVLTAVLERIETAFARRNVGSKVVPV